MGLLNDMKDLGPGRPFTGKFIWTHLEASQSQFGCNKCLKDNVSAGESLQGVGQHSLIDINTFRFGIRKCRVYTADSAKR